MSNETPKEGESVLQQHIRRVLAQLTALKDRQRAQEKIRQSRSEAGPVEVDREDDRSGAVDDADPPS